MIIYHVYVTEAEDYIDVCGDCLDRIENMFDITVLSVNKCKCQKCGVESDTEV